MKDKVLVGVIVGAFGVKGEVRLKSFTAEPSALADYGELLDEAGTQRFRITLTRPVKNGFAARLTDVNDKDAADALRGTRLFAQRSALPSLPDDEYYHADLIGLAAVDAGGVNLGRVKAVLNHGAGDLLELDRGPGVASVLVPFTVEIVPTVDLTAGKVVIDPPEGLLE